MAQWKKFEIQCTNFLNKNFGNYAKFYHEGGSNSKIPDILVETKSGKSFFIEVKHSPAQCGQFVLIPNLKNNSFDYSSRNETACNQYAKLIIDYMNTDFDAFREAGTTGKDIDIPNGSNIFANWIIQMYENKRVRFFITNDYTILPLHRFSEYFNISATYRIKRSGSSGISKTLSTSVINYIYSKCYTITNVRTENNKLFIKSPQPLNKQRFVYNENEFMFSLHGNEYEIRKLSNTYNANVIFSIEYKSNVLGISNAEFIDCLK